MVGFERSRHKLHKLADKVVLDHSLSTEQAIAYILNLVLENLDRGNCSARLFFADFRKAFDLIDHNILLHKLSGFDVHNALSRWVAAFLEGRTQFISLMDATSTARVLNGGIPQGTKLGPILFAIMVNDLVSSWVPRAKYVDDLTVLEVVPRNSPSMLNFLVNEIESYAISNNMRLNPLKCKELSVDFLRYNSCSWQPIAVGGAFIERVSCFKLLGVYISEDLSWACHCDSIIKRANRRLYALRVLKNCGLPMQDLLAVYCSLIRSILEYASIVFANLPQYLSNALENIQKSALGIIVPSMPYSQALHLTGLPSLQERRESACIRFISKISPGNPLYALILSRSQPRESPYNLRRNTNIVSKQTNTDRFSQFVTCKYATYLDS